MDVKSVLFYMFAAVLVLSSFRVVTVRNPVFAALYLILAFFQAAGIWLLLGAEFLSITLILVYVGAVMVLFLFVVMMLDINIESLRRQFWKRFPFALLLAGLVIAQMVLVLFNNFKQIEQALPMQDWQGSPIIHGASNTKELGKLIYTQYLFPLEAAAVLLLVAIIAAIALTLRQRKDSKFQAVSEQVRVKAVDRVRLVSIAAAEKNKEDLQ